MTNDKNSQSSNSQSKRGSESNPIELQEVVVYGKRPSWFKRNIINPVGRFINDEILLNKNNIRVKNARKHPKAMDAIQEGGNIAGAIVAAPFAAYAAAETAPIWMPALKTAGQAMTPSTWVGGFFDAFGTQAPAWLLNGSDLAASAYFAGQAGREIDKNGLNWKTGTNALLSLAPFTREESAIRAVGSTLRNPVSSFSSVIDDFRAARNAMSSPEANIAREFNRSVKNTRFVNVPIEHVSNRGMTEGAGLNSYSTSDVGFHFSPAGSPTTYNIQQATNAPFVRTGTWTYTNNTKPVFVIDKGNWRYSFNPEIYQGVNPGTTVAENAMALNQKGPNFAYVNNYEGKGAQSYMTTSPNFGISLSKNIAYEKIPVLEKEMSGVMVPDSPYSSFLGNFSQASTGEINGNIGKQSFTIRPSKKSDAVMIESPDLEEPVIFSSQNEALNFLKNEHEKYFQSLDPLRQEMYIRQNTVNPYTSTSIPSKGSSQFESAIKQKTQDDIDLFYGSDEYTERFNKRISDFMEGEYGIKPTSEQLEQAKAKFDEILLDIQNRYTPGMFKGSPIGFSQGDTMYIGLNSNLHGTPEIIDPTLTHEFGHLIYHYPFRHQTAGNRFMLVNDANASLMGSPVEHLTWQGLALPDNLRSYITSHNELRQRVIPVVKEMVENGWTAEEAYAKSHALKEASLDKAFDKDYIIKLLGGMLSIFPVIKKNDQSTDQG